jgi:hypothetical protein
VNLRDHLFQRLLPVVDRFAGEVADLIANRIEAELARVDEALATALSAYADGEDASDVEDAKPVRDRAVDRAAVQARRPRVQARARRAAADQGDRAPAVDTAVASAASSPAGQEAAPVTRKRKPNTCRKCGAIGFTAQGCGTSHQPMNREVVDGDRDVKPANVPVPAASKLDRFARIEAAARARRGAVQ